MLEVTATMRNGRGGSGQVACGAARVGNVRVVGGGDSSVMDRISSGELQAADLGTGKGEKESP